jgi:xylulokinase
VRDALAEAGHVTVTAMAVAGQMHGVVLVDERGAPLRPAILWLDQRAAAEVVAYAELPCEYTAVLGNRPSPGMAGPLLSWLVTHEPGTVRAAWWALQPKDWLRLRLTGQAATDPTDASGTLLFDLARNAWADPLIEKLGLPRGKLAPVRDSASLAGPLLPGPAADLGLRHGIPVAVGAGDTAAALLASGLRADEAMLNLGSGGQWVVLEDKFRPADTTNLYRAVGGGYYRLAPVQNVGVTLDWVRNLLGATWEELYATSSRPGRPDAPRFDPYLTPERWNPGATGAWTALTLADEREDLMRSALDGVAGLLRQRLDDLRAVGHAPKRVILGGGGTTNPAWRALLAQTLDLPLHDAPASWLTPMGAARLAVEVRNSSSAST